MNQIVYQNFDLIIEPVDCANGVYRSRVIDSPAGQATTEFTLPFDEKDLTIFLLRVGHPRRSVRRIDSPEMAAARDFGSQLFDAAFGRQIATCLDRSVDAARQQEKRLRIRLRLTDVPELVDLPWEFLHDTNLNRFYSQSVLTPIVRHLDLPWSNPPLLVESPLRILTVISDPNDVRRLDVEGEWTRLTNALSDLTERGLVKLERLQSPTLPALQRQLRRNQYHVLHFVGHGGFEVHTQTSVLLFEDDHGRSRRVDGDQLGTLLFDHPSLRLCMLNACEGARSDRTDVFSGVAQRLVQQGLPAVIAMQFEITDDAAITLCHEFYSALADGYPVDAALAEGRKSIFVQGNDIEWGTPVLYMRADDGLLFRLDESVVRRGIGISQPPKVRSAEAIPAQNGAVEPDPEVTEIESETVPSPPPSPIDWDWVAVASGEFQMGGEHGYDDEKPIHPVKVPFFYISKTPVTNSQYRQFVDAENHHQPEHWTNGQIPQGQENHPVVNVNWNDSVAFCKWAGVRLATEAEWEKAASWDKNNGTKLLYPWGDQAPGKNLCGFDRNVNDTEPVDNHPRGASPYGCLDMAGNVWEWCSTAYRNYPYQADDGREDLSGGCNRVFRGGAFYSSHSDVRCASRHSYVPANSNPSVGFRVASSGLVVT